jgi:ankyrin repeat protein
VHEPVVYLLLAHGADPALANSSGYTPLLMAVSENKQSIIQLLLAKGKNVKEWIDKKDSLDSTPLQLAIRQGTRLIHKSTLHQFDVT